MKFAPIKKYIPLLVALALVPLVLYLLRPDSTLKTYKAGIEEYSVYLNDFSGTLSSDDSGLIPVLVAFNKTYTLVEGTTPEGRFYYDVVMNNISKDFDCSLYDDDLFVKCFIARRMAGLDEDTAFETVKEAEIKTFEGLHASWILYHMTRVDITRNLYLNYLCQSFIELNASLGKPDDICGLAFYGILEATCSGDASVLRSIASSSPKNLREFSCYHKAYQFMETYVAPDFEEIYWHLH